jgi:glycosyltransferase involved in cell wall biosynthesis
VFGGGGRISFGYRRIDAACEITYAARASKFVCWRTVRTEERPRRRELHYFCVGRLERGHESSAQETVRSRYRDAHVALAISNLRLLVIASTFPAFEGDGTPAFVRDLAEYEARHFETLVLTPRVPNARATERHGDRLRIERFPYFPRRWERIASGAIIENVRAGRTNLFQVPALFGAEAFAVRRVVREFRPDVLHAHWIVPQGIVAVVAARRVPMVLSTLGGDIYALRGRFWDPVHRAVLRRASAVTTMNREMQARLLELGAPADRTHVLTPGTDIETIRAAGIGAAPVHGRVLVAGRLVEKKGFHILIDAVRQLRMSSWSLDVIGDGPWRGHLEAAAEGLPVRFLGQVGREQVGRALHEAAVFVVPSIRASSGDQDGVPIVLLDAMAAGCAIVASRLPGIDEALEDGRSGVLVSPGDTAELAQAIHRLLLDDKLRSSLGRAASLRAEDWGVDAVGARFVELLRSAAGR